MSAVVLILKIWVNCFIQRYEQIGPQVVKLGVKWPTDQS